MKNFLCYCLCVLLGSASLSAQITAYLHYPTDSIAVINPLQDLPPMMGISVTFSQPSHGVVTLLPTNKLQYVANSMGVVPYMDTFDFTVSNSTNSYNRSVTILPEFDDPMPNVPPFSYTSTCNACNDYAYLAFTPINLSMMDGNSDLPIYSIVQEPLHGTASIDSINLYIVNINYQPDEGFIGVDSIVYRACESNTTEHYCADVLQIIYVISCEALPLVAYDDGYHVFDLSSITLTPLDNDYADSSPITINIISQDSLGNAVVNPDNTITYNFNDVVVSNLGQMTYQICDTLGNCSDTATIHLVIVPPGWDPFEHSNVILEISTDESVELSFLSELVGYNIVGCLDTINSLLNYGSIALTSDGKYIYTPFEGIVPPQQSWVLSEYIPYNACVSFLPWGSPLLIVNFIFPVCHDDTTIIAYQTSTSISVLDNDLDGHPLNITGIANYPQHGTATVTDNQLLYQPDSAYMGNDTLQYIACDIFDSCDTATVFITVLPDSVIGIPSVFSNISLSTQLQVYPNPTRELLNIVVAPDQQIQSIMLTDMAGRRLFSPTLSTTVGNRAAVSVQHLPEGMYLVEVQTDVGVGVQRVLVE
ncbi:MAG: T9SS type A sorting domain-containing protein [Chitinophagales bacterium]|nr:T9SS type A sorting domain-containing protein [Chitinophagales bacterium]